MLHFSTYPYTLLQLQIIYCINMKVEVVASNLISKLSFLNHAVSSKSQLPILLNLLIDTIDGKLRLSSTDLEIGIESYINASIIEDGGIAVPARIFTELINLLPDSILTLQTTNNTLEVIGKRSKSVLQTSPKDDFPRLYENIGELIAIMKDLDLRKAFSMVVFSASRDITRPALSGVLIRREQDGFLLAATDGFRLSCKHYKLTSASKETNTSLIVPARVFRELLSIKETKKDTEMYIAESSNQILFKQNETIIIGRLIEAEFPNFEKIIPTDFSLSAAFDRKELLAAVKTCSIFAKESANIIKLNLQKDNISITSAAPQVGENTINIDASLSGEENEIAFNANYLLDILSNLSETDLIFEMTGPLNPGVFKIKDDPSFLHLIMPIRTGS